MCTIGNTVTFTENFKRKTIFLSDKKGTTFEKVCKNYDIKTPVCNSIDPKFKAIGQNEHTSAILNKKLSKLTNTETSDFMILDREYLSKFGNKKKTEKYGFSPSETFDDFGFDFSGDYLLRDNFKNNFAGQVIANLRIDGKNYCLVFIQADPTNPMIVLSEYLQISAKKLNPNKYGFKDVSIRHQNDPDIQRLLGLAAAGSKGMKRRLSRKGNSKGKSSSQKNKAKAHGNNNSINRRYRNSHRRSNRKGKRSHKKKQSNRY